MTERALLRVAALGALVALGLTFAGCRSRSRPPLPEWRACLFDRGKFDRLHAEIIVTPGTEPLLYLHSQWPEQLIGGADRAADLMVELRGGIAAGATTSFAQGAPAAEYEEGYGPGVFFSRTLDGTVRVLRSEPGSADLAVDVRVVAAVQDDRKLGQVPLQGTIKAMRVASMLDCRRLDAAR